MKPDPRGLRARRMRELAIAAVELWVAAKGTCAYGDANLALASVALLEQSELYAVVRPELERYLREQLGAGADDFRRALHLFLQPQPERTDAAPGGPS